MFFHESSNIFNIWTVSLLSFFGFPLLFNSRTSYWPLHTPPPIWLHLSSGVVSQLSQAVISVCKWSLGLGTDMHPWELRPQYESSRVQVFTGDWTLRSIQGPQSHSVKGWPTMKPPPFVWASSSFRLCPQVGEWRCLNTGAEHTALRLCLLHSHDYSYSTCHSVFGKAESNHSFFFTPQLCSFTRHLSVFLLFWFEASTFTVLFSFVSLLRINPVSSKKASINTQYLPRTVEPAKDQDMFLRSWWRPKQSSKQSEYYTCIRQVYILL